jgi:hypothetical protein
MPDPVNRDTQEAGTCGSARGHFAPIEAKSVKSIFASALVALPVGHQIPSRGTRLVRGVGRGYVSIG